MDARLAKADAMSSEDLRIEQRRFQNGEDEIAADLAGPVVDYGLAANVSDMVAIVAESGE